VWPRIVDVEARSWLLLGPAVSVVAFAVLAACSASTSPPSGGCPINPEVTCPASPPSWKTAVQPLIDGHCAPCHLDGGIETKAAHKVDFSTYDGVHSNLSPIVSAVGSCTMPPRDAGALSPDEAQTLLEWCHCGAPNN
jgi:uncharacterized membrane protein